MTKCPLCRLCSSPDRVSPRQSPALTRVLRVKARLSLLPLVSALLLSACSALPTPKAEVYTARPSVGQCWEATQKQAAKWTDWLGAGPVECTDEHTLETVAVLPVEGDFPATTGDEFPEEFIQAASATCEDPWFESTRWVKRPNRISNFFFYPAIEKYDAGERWVRCDVGVFATGTLWQSESHKLQVLTTSLAGLRSEQRSKPRLLALCLDSESTDIGTFGERLKVADCEQSHLWTMVDEVDLAKSANEKYPGPEEIAKRAEAKCTADLPEEVSGAFWLPPVEPEWERGRQSAFCFWAEVPVTSA